MFENGAQCWNGPSRSVEVSLECGAENKILSVSEVSNNSTSTSVFANKLLFFILAEQMRGM